MYEAERFSIKQIAYQTGTTAFRVQGRMPDGRQIRKNFGSFHEALSKKEELELKAQGQPVNFVLQKTQLTQEELADAEQAIRKLWAANETHPHLGGKSLLFTVEFTLANFQQPITSKAVREAVKQFLAIKLEKKKRHRTITDYASRLGKLVKKYGDHLVSEIKPDHLEALIQGCGYESVTQNHYRTQFRTFFKWCRRMSYCLTNPAEDIEKAEVDQPDPKILTLAQAKALLLAAHSYKRGLMIPYVTLGLFAGLRPAEIGRLRWNMIDLKAKQIPVTGFTAKRRKRRLVELSDNLIEWLRPFVGRPILPKNFRRSFDNIRRMAGFKGSLSKKKEDDHYLPWTEDIVRHTAISHHYANCENEAKTAKWAGQSPDVMHTHYKGLVSKLDARTFWTWTPPHRKGLGQPVPTTKSDY